MLTYSDAGVNIDAGNALVQRIRALNPAIGGFSGTYPLGDQLLVASTDGVGTKLKLAFALNRHDTIGQDLVAMSVNDIIVCGARPLFFLDYFATSKLSVDQAETVIAGIARACTMASVVLLGGQTAEMPDFYSEGEYDLSGFAVGVVHKDALIDGSSICAGDSILGLASSGVHSNGFSLVRKILECADVAPTDLIDGFDRPIGEVLLAPTRIYVAEAAALQARCKVKGHVHVTGGGFFDNIPRVLPAGLGCAIQTESWTRPPIFDWLQDKGGVTREEMYRTFNMGMGFLAVLGPDDVAAAQELGWTAIGTINETGSVTLC